MEGNPLEVKVGFDGGSIDVGQQTIKNVEAQIRISLLES